MPIEHHYRQGIPARIVERAERLIDRGNNLFIARSLPASIAISIFFNEQRVIQEVKDEANQGIIDALLERGAEGLVFTDNFPDKPMYQTDIVAVTARDGEPTYIYPAPMYGPPIIRAATEGAELWHP